MNHKQLAAQQLQDRLGKLIKCERALLNEILDLINEADSERSYLILGFSSLFTWLTGHFHYCESSAKRRIDAARLKRDIPTIENKIEGGSLNVTIMSKAQSAIRAEEKRTNLKLTIEKKIQVVEKIEGKTSDEAERILMQEFPEAQIFQKEKTRVVSPTEMSILGLMTHEDYVYFLRAKELLSHTVPCGSPGKIMAAVFREFVQRKDPLKAQSAKKSQRLADSEKSDASASALPKTVPSEPAARSRYIQQSVRRAVFIRDAGACQFHHPATGRICGSRHQIEVDHIRPWALGGENTVENLRCLCASHNRHRAEITFGARRSS